MDRRESLIERIDRRLGMLWARFCGTLLGLGGAMAIFSAATLPDFSFGKYWPVLAMGAVLLAGAAACFRSRRSLLDQLSELPGDPPPKSRR
jgi:hypothetical protein